MCSKGGFNIKIEDAIMDMGAKIRDTQVLFGGGMLKTVSKTDYKYKTNVPKFVDSIAIPKIHEVMKRYQWNGDNIFYIDERKCELVTWSNDDWAEVETNDRVLRINKKHFRRLYENRD